MEIQGDAFVFGGMYWLSGSFNYNSAIYRLTCSSGICSWSTLNQELQVGIAVAIPVPDYFCKGKEGMLDHLLVKHNQKLQEVPAFHDFWFQRVIMKCGDHEFLGLFFSVKP